MGRIQQNYIKTRGEPKIFYGKGIGVLLEIILGNIKKKRLKSKELIKDNEWGLGVLEDFTTAI